MKVRRSRGRRVRQGDIYSNVEFIEFAVEAKGLIDISKIVFPLVIVLTQDCDLEQDSKVRYGKIRSTTQDKLLLSVLVAPLYNIEHVCSGEHLSELEIKMEPIRREKTPGQYLISNQRPRYHYLDFPPGVPIVPSVIDFKHYFSVTVEYLRSKSRDFVCAVAPLDREDVSQRFASYLSRIGLPSETSPRARAPVVSRQPPRLT